jgi:transposase
MSLDELFVDVDDFCIRFEAWLKQPQIGQGKRKPGPRPSLAASEIMTILIYFHVSHYRNFKRYYLEHVHRYLKPEFPGLVSYTRFVELMPLVLPGLCFYLWSKFGPVSGISFIDVTPIPVCHNKRIERHKVFDGLAERGKSSMGWFYGFKLHLVVNDQGEILAFYLTPGNVDDRKPVPKLTEKLFGKLFADKGYISKALFKALFERGLQLITPIRKNMKNQLMPLMDKLLLRKRSIIETINDQLKNISQISHTRHRSVNNFLVNLIAGLVAYTHQPKKPSLNLSKCEQEMLPAVI